jgi:hypothetical protein
MSVPCPSLGIMDIILIPGLWLPGELARAILASIGPS